MIENRLFPDTASLWSAIDNLFEDAPVPTVLLTALGIGYCESVPCYKYLKATVLFKYEGDFTCGLCGGPGLIVEERGIPDRKEGQLYGEIRIEYCYCPVKKDYQEIAIVRDENLGSDVGIYTAQMPSVRTSHRALKIAESLLATLNFEVEMVDPCVVPRHKERILDLDKPLGEIQDWLHEFELRIKGNPFYVAGRNDVVSQCIEVVPQIGEINES